MPFLKVSISFFIQKRENEEKDIVLLQLSITGCIFPAIAICLLRIHLPMILSARIIPFIFLLRLICLHLKKYFYSCVCCRIIAAVNISVLWYIHCPDSGK